MTVNTINAGYNPYSSFDTSSNYSMEQQYLQSSADKSVIVDTVSISDEAKALLQADEAASSNSKNTNNFPLEAYALPNWFDGYIVSSSVQSGKLDHDFWNFIGGLTSDNTISSDEKAQIKEYLQNDPAHQQNLADDKFASEHKNDIKNYITSLDTYFKEALKENGVTSTQDYYNKVILNKDTSEQIHQMMVNKIKNDSNIQSLMDILGVKG